MAIRHLLWGAALTAALSATLVAQQAPASSPEQPNEFFRSYCVKVKPGKGAEFVDTVNSVLRKYAQSDADTGTISRWSALRAVDPTGREAECDYRFAYFYPGLPPAPMSDEETTAALQKAGLDMNAQQLMQRLNDVGILVYSSINEHVAMVGGAKEGDYISINEMRVPDIDNWITSEKKLWQPVFEDGLKDGAIAGWAVGVEIQPHGDRDRGRTYTVDIFPSWDAVFKFFGPTFPDRWKKVHPDMPIADALAGYAKVRTMEHTALYQVVAAVQPSK
jgi:hypothetical protein